MKGWWINSTMAVLIAALAIGCGESKDKPGEGGTKKEVITDKGSDTMILLATQWAEEYGKTHPNVEIQVTGGGSGTGISALINGTTDIANASRPMKDEEKQQIKEKYGNDVVEIPVAKDGVAIYVHASSSVESLTVEQLLGIYTGTITNWKDVGGSDAKIILYGRENSSGTYLFFKEHVLKNADFAPHTQTLPGTAAIVDAVGKDANGIGYGGGAYAQQSIKEVKIIGEGGMPFAPTEENVRSGAYPLARSLYFYLRNQPTGAIKDYIDWVLGDAAQAMATNAGYFSLK